MDLPSTTGCRCGPALYLYADPVRLAGGEAVRGLPLQACRGHRGRGVSGFQGGPGVRADPTVPWVQMEENGSGSAAGLCSGSPVSSHETAWRIRRSKAGPKRLRGSSPVGTRRGRWAVGVVALTISFLEGGAVRVPTRERDTPRSASASGGCRSRGPRCPRLADPGRSAARSSSRQRR